MSKKVRRTAEELGKKHKAVSVAEFFERNRHLLGFDNKRKALLTVIKEAVDNALDACEEARILPEIIVEIVEMGSSRFRVAIEDNGPGIIKKNIPNVFAKLLYGSKFHTMKQARGQQGIGISAAVLYAQLTTGRPARITSRTAKGKPAHYYELKIDTMSNTPEITKDEVVEWDPEHGTRIELDIEASYLRGGQSVDAYLKQTAIVNPHATIIYTNPKAEQLIFPRASDELPPEPKEIKPHPYGVELGILLKILRASQERTLQACLQKEFSRVSAAVAKEICEKSAIPPKTKPDTITHRHAERILEAIKNTKIIAPSTDCIVPIGSSLLEAGLRKEIAAEFYVAKQRSPTIYKGIPFVVEVALAWGGHQPKDKSVNLLRFANRVPLLYQQSACASFKSVVATGWRKYGLGQSRGALPVGPLTVVVHLASVWPPFTSEAKEAMAHYPEIIKEMKLALQEAGRDLGRYVNKKKRAAAEQERVSLFEVYIPEIAAALERLTQENKEALTSQMKQMLEKNKALIMKNKGFEAKKKEIRDETDKIALVGNLDTDDDEEVTE